MTPDYPAAHSMDTRWFAVDGAGHLAVFTTGEAGALPMTACAHDNAHTVQLRLAEVMPAVPPILDVQGRFGAHVEGHSLMGDRAHNALFQNPGHGNHWLTLRLIGSKTNRAAIGARVRVDLPGPDGGVASRHRGVTSGSSYGGNPFPMTIGLGKADKVLGLEVVWPTSRTRQAFRDVPIDRAIEITEGRDAFRVLDTRPIPLPGEAKPTSRR